MSYQNIITIEPGKRSGKPCIRGMRITVYDILEYVWLLLLIERKNYLSPPYETVIR